MLASCCYNFQVLARFSFGCSHVHLINMRKGAVKEDFAAGMSDGTPVPHLSKIHAPLSTDTTLDVDHRRRRRRKILTALRPIKATLCVTWKAEE